MSESIPEVATVESAEPESPKKISKEEVEVHNTKTDVWIIIRDKVYDVTQFLDEVRPLLDFYRRKILKKDYFVASRWKRHTYGPRRHRCYNGL